MLDLLGLCFAAIPALAIPPSLAITVDEVAGSTLNQDVLTRHSNERTLPLLVPESSLALENELSRHVSTHSSPQLIPMVEKTYVATLLQVSKIQSLSSRDADIIQGELVTV